MSSGLGCPGPYAGAAETWQRDAMSVYGPLARHLLAVRPGGRPIEVAGCRVLDAGAGSGVVGDLLRTAGAEVISVDLEPDMVAALAAKGPAVLADVRDLPFPADDVAVAAAAFVLNHLPEPEAGLAELGRVTSPDGWVVASVFGNDRPAAKSAIDAVATRFGFASPDWYVDLQRAAAGIGTVDGLRAAALRAGLRPVLVDEQPVDVGLHDPADVVRYRLAMPHLRPFVQDLEPASRTELCAAATAAVAEVGMPFRPTVIRLAAQPSRPATTSRSR